jgi:hypothetical protein
MLHETYVLIVDAASYLGVSEPRVHQLVSRKKLVASWVNGRRVVTQKSLVDYAKERAAAVERERARVADAPCSQSTGQSASSCSRPGRRD